MGYEGEGCRPGSMCQLLTWHREVLVSQLKSTQCILDNLAHGGFLCSEDVEIVQRATTAPDKVRKILELVQSKGEEACECFIYVLYKVRDAYIDLQPWLKEINYQPAEFTQKIQVVNTDPISRYCEKLRDQLGRDTHFITSYAQREETLLDDLYIDTLMEMLNLSNESLGFLESPDQLLGDEGVFNRQAETIYVTGDAGVGKSILLQKLQNLWSKRELRTAADAMFFFKFRCRMFSAFKDTDAISLRDLLFRHNCYPDQDVDDEAFSYILRFPEKAVFTFDGYDEIHGDLDLVNAPAVASPHDKAHPLLLLIGLLCGNLLRGSRKVLTARTGTEFPQSMIRKKVVLRGFSPAHLQAYTALHFKGQEHRSRVSTQLGANPHLGGLCSTPLFCWIVFKSFKLLHKMHDKCELPEATCITLTGVFLLLSEVCLSRAALPPPGKAAAKRSARCTSQTFKAGLRPLSAFGRLALQGLQTGTFIFGQEEVTACGLTEEDLQVGFLRPVGHYDACGSSATYEFLHMTLQSFLAAFSLVLDEQADTRSVVRFFAECSRKKETPCLPCASCISGASPNLPGQDLFRNTEHLQFANLFLCGLLSKANAGLLEHTAPPATLKKKRDYLKGYLSNSIRSHLRGLPNYTHEGTRRVHVMPNFLWTLRCIYETGSKDVAQLAAKGITATFIKVAYCNVCSADCSALNFVLQHRDKPIGVDLDNNNIGDYGVMQLKPSFCRMTVLRLSVNQISDSCMEVLAEELCKHKMLEYLGLYNNHITDVGARLVGRIIEECPKLLTVKMGKNKLTAIGGQYLASAIQKSTCIFDVGMWGNAIGDEGAKAFADAMTKHPSLTNLSLSANGITSEGGRILAEALHDNTCLKIFWLVENQLCDSVAPHLAELVRKNTGLSHLWLISNQLTVDGVRKLSEALSDNTTLTEICIKGNQVSVEEEKLFESEKRLKFH